MSKHAIVDLEMCKSVKQTQKKPIMEIIQIGAVLLNEDNNIIDTFNIYVKPEYGYVDGFIHGLTGINNSDLVNAPMIEEAMEQFMDWLPEDVICVSWSDTDKHQIKKELKYKNINIAGVDKILEQWQDCQKMFSKKLKEKKAYSLEEALNMCDIEAEGKAHNGYYDARNTATLYTKMETEKDFKINELYKAAKDNKVEGLSYSMGELFAGLKLED